MAGADSHERSSRRRENRSESKDRKLSRGHRTRDSRSTDRYDRQDERSRYSKRSQKRSRSKSSRKRSSKSRSRSRKSEKSPVRRRGRSRSASPRHRRRSRSSSFERKSSRGKREHSYDSPVQNSSKYHGPRKSIQDRPQGREDEREPRQRYAGQSAREDTYPELFTIHRGRVMSLHPFGAFVKMDGFRSNGLVHISQIKRERVEKTEDALTVDQQVFVKVLRVEDTGGSQKRVALSMKSCDQTTGRDLDPSNNEANPELRGNRGPREPERISLGAVYNVTCRKCGGSGHLPSECFVKEGQTYDLVKDSPVRQPPVSRESNGLQSMKGFHRHAPPQQGGGRGRAMTLPAWMTAETANVEEKRHKTSNSHKAGDSTDKHRKDSDDERRDRKKEKKHKHSSSHKLSSGHKRRKSSRSRSTSGERTGSAMSRDRALEIVASLEKKKHRR